MVAFAPFREPFFATLLQQRRPPRRSRIITTGFRAIVPVCMLGEMKQPLPFDGLLYPRRIVKRIVHLRSAAVASDRTQKGERTEYPAATPAADQPVPVILRRFQIATGKFAVEQLEITFRDKSFARGAMRQIFRKERLEKFGEHSLAAAFDPQCGISAVDDPGGIQGHPAENGVPSVKDQCIIIGSPEYRYDAAVAEQYLHIIRVSD